MQNKRIVFAGTPEFAATALHGILKNPSVNMAAVYTQPDRPAGRGQHLLESPVKLLAKQCSIPVEQPENFKYPETIARLKTYNPDIIIVAAYGLILPKQVLDIPTYCCLNIHASLLPRWRGAAPIQHAILAGDKQSGISIMAMDTGLDTGDVLLETTISISDTETGSSLHDKLAVLGANAINETLDNFDTLFSQRCPQNPELANYAHKIQKADAHINWSDTAKNLDRQIRAYNSWPVCFSKLDDKHIRIWEARADVLPHTYKPGEIVSITADGIRVACSNGFITILKLQLPGKKALPASEVLKSQQSLFTSGKCFE